MVVSGTAAQSTRRSRKATRRSGAERPLSIGGGIDYNSAMQSNAANQRRSRWLNRTMLGNVSGCFFIGFLATLSGPAMGRGRLKPEWRDFWLAGFAPFSSHLADAGASRRASAQTSRACICADSE
jgi:hypothetical protein